MSRFCLGTNQFNELKDIWGTKLNLPSSVPIWPVPWPYPCLSTKKQLFSYFNDAVAWPWVNGGWYNLPGCTKGATLFPFLLCHVAQTGHFWLPSDTEFATHSHLKVSLISISVPWAPSHWVCSALALFPSDSRWNSSSPCFHGFCFVLYCRIFFSLILCFRGAWWIMGFKHLVLTLPWQLCS